MPSAATVRLLPDGKRLHLQHGPIDLIIEGFGKPEEVVCAYRQAWYRFRTLLEELVGELLSLRRPVDASHPGVSGAVARRMLDACRPHANEFITPMAAVAGAVADEIMAAMLDGRTLDRAYVNNGGDIALHLSAGTSLDVGLVADVEHPALSGVATIDSAWPVRGMATSGWRGRSFSLGIADAATVLARDGASADAAVTLIANAINVEHPAIIRTRASDLDDNSDLGDRLVTTGVGPLPDDLVTEALARGASRAGDMVREEKIFGAVLALKGRVRVVGPIRPRLRSRGEHETLQTLCVPSLG
ncbi:MAG TPA: UPF0280 family protein [Stellaceae bacterium]|nr:UPF0280 family protein [Stellaceae bacterium]